MKYKTTGTRAGHKVFVRERETAFEKKPVNKTGSFEPLVDHKEMKTYEYAAFQKKVFKEKKRQKKKYYIIIVLTVITVIIILLILPTMLKFIFK